MNEQQLKEVFAKTFDIPVERVTDDLSYDSFAAWDSIAHMALIAAIDQTFKIMMDTEDVIDLNSFAKAKSLLTKYNILF